MKRRGREREKAKRDTGRATPIGVEHGQCFIRALSVYNIAQLARARAFSALLKDLSTIPPPRSASWSNDRSAISPRSAVTWLHYKPGIMLFFMPCPYTAKISLASSVPESSCSSTSDESYQRESSFRYCLAENRDRRIVNWRELVAKRETRICFFVLISCVSNDGWSVLMETFLKKRSKRSMLHFFFFWFVFTKSLQILNVRWISSHWNDNVELNFIRFNSWESFSNKIW